MPDEMEQLCTAAVALGQLHAGGMVIVSEKMIGDVYAFNEALATYEAAEPSDA